MACLAMNDHLNRLENEVPDVNSFKLYSFILAPIITGIWEHFIEKSHINHQNLDFRALFNLQKLGAFRPNFAGWRAVLRALELKTFGNTVHIQNIKKSYK